ncbi:hypothetical protein SUDANB105_00709 [Streptomyces sp. enrichment culture]
MIVRVGWPVPDSPPPQATEPASAADVTKPTAAIRSRLVGFLGLKFALIENAPSHVTGTMSRAGSGAFSVLSLPDIMQVSPYTEDHHRELESDTAYEEPQKRDKRTEDHHQHSRPRRYKESQNDVGKPDQRNDKHCHLVYKFDNNRRNEFGESEIKQILQEAVITFRLRARRRRRAESWWRAVRRRAECGGLLYGPGEPVTALRAEGVGRCCRGATIGTAVCFRHSYAPCRPLNQGSICESICGFDWSRCMVPGAAERINRAL